MKIYHVFYYTSELGCILHVTSNLLEDIYYQAGDINGCLLAATVRFVPFKGL